MATKLPKPAAPGGRTGNLPRGVLTKPLRTEGGRRRKMGLQPWRRGRIRPTTCRDHVPEE